MKSHNSIIQEVLIAQAAKLTIKKIKEQKMVPTEAIVSVVKTMNLTEEEKTALEDKLAADPAVPVDPPDSKEKLANTIFFNSLEDQEVALGMLMYKGIAWSKKGKEKDYYIQLPDASTMSEAKEMLGKKWHFVDNTIVEVANISFDNMEDYHKVVDFMVKNKMIVEPDTKIVTSTEEPQSSTLKSFQSKSKVTPELVDSRIHPSTRVRKNW